ncbi:MAG TPA: S8 family serine peptidase [Herpetosiphonaceae bacterium]
MRLRALVVIVALYVLAFQPVPARGAGQAEGNIRRVQPAIPDQYVVVLKDDIAPARVAGVAADLARTHGGTLHHVYQHALKGFSLRLPEAAASRLSRDPRVAYVAEDGRVGLVDTQFNPPWGLDRIDQNNRPLNSAYTYNTTGEGVNVYVIDTGIRPTHQEFGGRAAIAYDAFGGNGQDCNGHGTHVAGTVGGSTYGVAKRARIYGVRVLDCGGSGSFSGVIAGVDWVTNNRALPAVANMSLGGSAYDPLDTAVRNSIQRGITYAIAAGNSNADARGFSPARVAQALTVGATDIADNRASFSNYGPVVDVFAPGVSVISAWIGSDTATNTISGTSMASPHVAGVAALYLQSNPGASPTIVSQMIKSNASLSLVVNPGAGSPNRLLYSGFVPSSAINPIDNSRFFVWQHYLDFLVKEPDEPGLNFWTSQITQCGGDAACIDRERVHVSRAFWESIEFLQRQPTLASYPQGTPEYNQEFVRLCYVVYLQRDPDAPGYNFWLNDLNSNNDYDHIIRAFLLSIEYRARFGQT